MRIKILTTETDQQLILRPENDFEKKVCDMFKDMPNTYRGDFEECQGGYYRNFGYEKDLIIKFPKQK